MKNLQFKIIISILLLIVIMIIIGVKIYNKPHVDVVKTTANFKLSSTDLLDEFILDENIAAKKFANKIVEITGIIQNVSTTKGKGIITLKGTEANVICQLNEKENKKIMQLKKHQNITIKGQCSGFLLDVMLVNCVVKQ